MRIRTKLTLQDPGIPPFIFDSEVPKSRGFAAELILSLGVVNRTPDKQDETLEAALAPISCIGEKLLRCLSDLSWGRILPCLALPHVESISSSQRSFYIDPPLCLAVPTIDIWIQIGLIFCQEVGTKFLKFYRANFKKWRRHTSICTRRHGITGPLPRRRFSR